MLCLAVEVLNVMKVRDISASNHMAFINTCTYAGTHNKQERDLVSGCCLGNFYFFLMNK